LIAFIFPGQGSQKVGMGRALADAFPEARATFDEADAALAESETLTRLIFEGPEDQLVLTQNAQPAILTVSIAAYRVLASRGIEPAFVAGHSLG
jgi:[acyl-carrier-protein] S-malonyltransferase